MGIARAEQGTGRNTELEEVLTHFVLISTGRQATRTRNSVYGNKRYQSFAASSAINNLKRFARGCQSRRGWQRRHNGCQIL